MGHRAGAIVGFDLAHAMGNVPLKLHEWGVDFAAWCSYKYLNAGPGSVAGIYIHERHLNNPAIPRLEGWWGHAPESRFLMRPDFIGSKTAEAWQLSNAPVFSMAPLLASLQLFQEAGEKKRQEKTRKLSAFFMEMLAAARQNECKVETLSPAEFPHRGCQWSLTLTGKNKDAFKALSKAGIVADWREPNVIRVAPVPLYNNFEDICHFFSVLSHIYSS
jgi:kynureninase